MKNIEDKWGEKLTQTLVKINSDFDSNENEVLADEIMFIFETFKLRILPFNETDEIDLRFSEKDADISDKSFVKTKHLNKFLGKNLSQIWKCFNSKNYFDLFIIGFHGLHPSLMILSEGNTLKIFDASEVKN